MEELVNSPTDVKQFISNYFKKLYDDPKWLEAIKAIARHERARNIVLGTMERIIKFRDQ